MGYSFLFCAILAVCTRSTLGFLACSDSTGISFIPCSRGSGSGGGSGGNGGTTNTKIIQPCNDEQYQGPKSPLYSVAGNELPEEFDLVITALTLGEGEQLQIKTLRCGSEKVCKIAVIDSTAMLPIRVTMNKRQFNFVSHSSTASATFYVDHNCDGGGGGDVVVDCNTEGFIQNEIKRLKFVKKDATFDDCFNLCETHYSRMIKTVNKEELRSTIKESNAWIGLKQIDLDTYQWTDGDRFTVSFPRGSIPLYSSLVPWYRDNTYPSSFDVLGVRDDKDCTYVNYFEWFETSCNALLECYCECKPE